MVEDQKKEKKRPGNGEIEYDAIIKLRGSVKWKVIGIASLLLAALSLAASVVLKLLGVGAD